MLATLKNPIKKLPTPISGISAEVTVQNMKWEHAVFWHNHVQPLIDGNYQHYQSNIPEENVRADVGWNWKSNYLYAIAHTCSTPFPGNHSGPARALIVGVRTKQGGEVPLGMLTVVPKFFCRVAATSETRSFAWFLSDAPAELYDALQIQPLRKMAMSLLDTAIQSGLDDGTDGQLLLHADPAGGKKLQRFYRDRCKMIQLQDQSDPVSLLRRTGQDEYFYLSSEGSRVFTAQFDAYREPEG